MITLVRLIFYVTYSKQQNDSFVYLFRFFCMFISIASMSVERELYVYHQNDFGYGIKLFCFLDLINSSLHSFELIYAFVYVCLCVAFVFIFSLFFHSLCILSSKNKTNKYVYIVCINGILRFVLRYAIIFKIN